MRPILFAAFGIIVLSSTTCKKIGCAETIFNFEAKAIIMNNKESFNLGDTLFLTITCLVLQKNNNVGQNIAFKKAANLGTSIGFGELIQPEVKEAANDFNFILLKGRVANNLNTNAIREYIFSENDFSYNLTLGIIPKKRGIFSIGLSNANNVYRVDDKCTKANYRIFFDATEQHSYLLKQVLGVEPPAPPNGTYFFKVE